MAVFHLAMMHITDNETDISWQRDRNETLRCHNMEVNTAILEDLSEGHSIVTSRKPPC